MTETQWMILGFVVTVGANALVVGMFVGSLRSQVTRLIAEVQKHGEKIDALELDMVAVQVTQEIRSG